MFSFAFVTRPESDSAGGVWIRHNTTKLALPCPQYLTVSPLVAGRKGLKSLEFWSYWLLLIKSLYSLETSWNEKKNSIIISLLILFPPYTHFIHCCSVIFIAYSAGWSDASAEEVLGVLQFIMKRSQMIHPSLFTLEMEKKNQCQCCQSAT